VDDRLVLMERLKRKYGPSLEDVVSHHDRCNQELAGLAHLDERAVAVAAELDGARTEYLTRAGALSDARRKAADAFGSALEASLEELAMARTRFAVRFQAIPLGDTDWTARGIDHAEFLVSPNPGEDLRPLARIASGGELSRMMLALRGLSRGSGRAPTLIFDEVDAGIGGRAADDVGRKLRTLGRDAQVLCITHLPQIAAAAGTHFRVSKVVRDGRTITLVERLRDQERHEELARMMAGAAITPAVLLSARELLKRGGESEGRAKGESESRRAKGRK
jgi:DNA repair protein RecN (Recombination protein N)